MRNDTLFGSLATVIPLGNTSKKKELRYAAVEKRGTICVLENITFLRKMIERYLK